MSGADDDDEDDRRSRNSDIGPGGVRLLDAGDGGEEDQDERGSVHGIRSEFEGDGYEYEENSIRMGSPPAYPPMTHAFVTTSTTSSGASKQSRESGYESIPSSITTPLQPSSHGSANAGPLSAPDDNGPHNGMDVDRRSASEGRQHHRASSAPAPSHASRGGVDLTMFHESSFPAIDWLGGIPEIWAQYVNGQQ